MHTKLRIGYEGNAILGDKVRKTPLQEKIELQFRLIRLNKFVTICDTSVDVLKFYMLNFKRKRECDISLSTGSVHVGNCFNL